MLANLLCSSKRLLANKMASYISNQLLFSFSFGRIKKSAVTWGSSGMFYLHLMDSNFV